MRKMVYSLGCHLDRFGAILTAPLPPHSLHIAKCAALTHLNCRSNYATLKTNIKMSSTRSLPLISTFIYCTLPGECEIRENVGNPLQTSFTGCTLQYALHHNITHAMPFLFIYSCSFLACYRDHKMNVNKIQFNFAVNKSCEVNEITIK